VTLPPCAGPRTTAAVWWVRSRARSRSGAGEGAKPRFCVHLSLTATRKGVSYQRIELWVGQSKHEPVRADLYVQSEKLAKQARFVLNPAGTEVDEMLLSDHLSSHKRTRIQYVARKSRQVPDTWLNPMFWCATPHWSEQFY